MKVCLSLAVERKEGTRVKNYVLSFVLSVDGGTSNDFVLLSI